MTAPVFSRMLKPPKGSFFLFGPRGTGKSTWLRTEDDIEILPVGEFLEILEGGTLFGKKRRR